MKNKMLPIIIGVVVIIGIIFFMQGGDRSAKKSGDSSQPIVIPTHNWSSQIVKTHENTKIIQNIRNKIYQEKKYILEGLVDITEIQ